MSSTSRKIIVQVVVERPVISRRRVWLGVSEAVLSMSGISRIDLEVCPARRNERTWLMKISLSMRETGWDSASAGAVGAG